MPMIEHTNQPFDPTNIRDLLTIIFKHKGKVAITFLLIFVGVALYAVVLPKTYEAESVLLVKFGREFMSRPEVGSGGGSGFAIPPETIMRGEISILTSRDLIDKTVKAVGARTLYPGLGNLPPGKLTPEQVAIESFEKSLKVTNVPGSSLLQVAFTHSDPQVAAKAVNTLVEAFKEKHLEVFGGNSTSFLEAQEKAFQTKLRESEGNLAAFKQKHGVISLEEQRTNLIEQISTLEGNYRAAQNQISELEQKIAFIRSPRWTIDTPAEMRTQLATLQQRERELLERYTESSSAVRNARQEVQVAKDAIKRTMEELRHVELGKVEGELSVVKARAESLKRQLGQVQGEVRSLDARGRELQELKREATQQEQNYQTYSRKFEESLIMDDMDRRKMVAISVVEKATPPAMPKKQKLDKRQMVGTGFLGGIAAGIALAFILEFMTSSMTTPFSAEHRLGLPVLVAVTKK